MAKKQVKKILKDGGKTKQNPPIYTSDPHDPRLQAYNDSLSAYNTGKNFTRLNDLYGQKGTYYDKPHTPSGRNHIEGMSFGEENLPENYYSAKGLPIADISRYYNKPDGPGYRQLMDNNLTGTMGSVSEGMNEVKKWSHAFDKYKTQPESVKVVPDKEAYLFLPQYTKPVQPYLLDQSIQQLPISQPNQLPINTPQQQELQKRYPDTPNYNDGVMDDYHRNSGLYQNGGQVNMNKKTSKKILNKVMPIKALNGASVDGDLRDDMPISSVPQVNSMMSPDSNEMLTNGSAPPPMTPQQYNGSGMKFDSTQAQVTKKKGFWNEDPDDPDTTKVAGQDSQGYFRQHPMNITGSFDTTNVVTGAIAGINALLPEKIAQDNQKKLKEGYNPRPYGDGTSAIGKFGKTFDDGGIVNRNNWNALQDFSARNAQNYGADQYNHGNYGNDVVNAFNQANPTQAIPISDIQKYQQDMTGNPQAIAPAGFSPIDNKFGAKTMQQSYMNYQTEHYDGKGKLISHNDYKTDYAGANKEVQGWNKPMSVQAPEWESNDKGIPMPSMTGNIQGAGHMVPQKMPQKNNFHTDEDTNYSIDSVREAESGIHIKPSHKGRFTAYKKAHHVTTEQALHSKSAHVRQMANFAKNAKKWKHEDGGEIEDFEAANGITILGEGSIQPMGANAYSNPMGWSQGPSHDDGGMPIQVGNQNAEIQGGEGVQQHNDGSTVVYGKMKIPNMGPEGKGLSGRTFQSIAKEIAQQEEKNTKKLAVPAKEISDNFNPANKYDSLKLGSAMAMDSAFKMRSAALTAQKDHLKNIQEMMQTDADEKGVDYSKAHSIYAKNGATLNGKSGFTNKYDPAILADQTKMMKEHQDWVDEALTKYGKPKAGKFDDGIDGLRTQFVKNYVTKKQGQQITTTGPTSTHIDRLPVDGPSQMPVIAPTQQKMQPVVVPGQEPKSPNTTRTPYTSLADDNRLGVTDFLSEINYLGKRPDQVLGQQYHPYLETPYQVSYQDRRNANQSTFNEVSRQLQGTGSAASLAALAGQKYEADNQVNAEEFRTNQGIYNQVTNQNYNTLNEAEKMNIGLKDQQYVRQSQAKSNTDAQKAQALASIANKIGANRYENMNIRLAEQRSGFRPVQDPKTGQMVLQYQGPDASFNPYGSGNAANPYNKVEEKYGPDGNLESTTKVRNYASSKWGNIFNS